MDKKKTTITSFCFFLENENCTQDDDGENEHFPITEIMWTQDIQMNKDFRWKIRNVNDNTTILSLVYVITKTWPPIKKITSTSLHNYKVIFVEKWP